MKSAWFAAVLAIFPAVAQADMPHPSCRSGEVCNWQLIGPDGKVVRSGISQIGCEKQLGYYPGKGARCVQQ